MPLFEMTPESLVQVPSSTFVAEQVLERADLQRLLRARIDVVIEDVLIVSEEFGAFADARHRIDLLGIDRDGHLVVFELKRTSDGGHLELQALRYAAMVSTMTFSDLVEHYEQYLARVEPAAAEQARERLISWLEEADGESTVLSREVRIVLVSGGFDREITTTVLWLNDVYTLDIRCIKLTPYKVGERLLLDVQQVIPLPEASDLTIQLKRQVAQARAVRSGDRRETATRRLANAEAVDEGTTFTLRPYGRIPDSVRQQLTAWLAEDQRRGSAQWRNDPVKPLVWQLDGQPYSPGGLVRAITREAVGEERSEEGTRWWIDPDGFDLVELAKPLACDRAPLYQEFWAQLLEQLARLHPDGPVPSAPARDWISFPGGYRLARWGMSFARGQRLRSELYLPASVTTADARYQALYSVASQIDAAYGSPLSWEPLHDRKSCRVATYRAGEIERSEEHDEYIAWFITSQEHLREAIASVASSVGWLTESGG